MLWRFKAGNDLEGWPAEILGPLSIEPGAGNRIVIEKGVRFEGVSIRFTGSGNTIVFRENTTLKGCFIVKSGGTVEIGAGTRFNKMAWIQALGGKSIRIGKDCLFADIRIRTSDVHKIYDAKSRQRLNPPKDVTIGDSVWIAEGASIYKGARIGAGCVIGAHAIVIGEIPARSLAAGVPATVKKTGITWKR